MLTEPVAQFVKIYIWPDKFAGANALDVEEPAVDPALPVNA
jgi:hypothetical protein